MLLKLINTRLGRRVVSLGAMAALCLPALAHGQSDVVGSFRGQQQGAICGATTAKPDTLESFAETTQAQTPNSQTPGKVVSTFRLELPAVCAAPYFKAFELNEMLDAEFKYVDRQTHNAVLTVSLPHARLMSIELSASTDSGVPIITLDLNAPEVTMGGPSSTTATSGARSSGVSGGKPRAPTIRRDLAVRPRLATAAPAAAWAQGGIGGTNVLLGGGSSPVNVTFVLKNFRLSCHALIDSKTGLRASHPPKITLADMEKPVDANSAAIHNLVGHQAIPGSFTIVNRTGTAGITLTFPHLLITSDRISGIETIAAATTVFHVTDSISGAGVVGGC